MKFLTKQQKLQALWDNRSGPIYKVIKTFAYLPISSDTETFWLETVYIKQRLIKDEGFFFDRFLAWEGICFVQKNEYEQYLKDITDGK